MAGRQRKSAVWIAVIMLAGLGGFAYGFLCNESKLPPYPLARKILAWAHDQEGLRKLRYLMRGRPNIERRRVSGSWQHLGEGTSSNHRDLEAARREFQGIGYLSGYEPATDLKGVTVYIPGQAYDGFNLITSGHGEEALLVSMDGRVVHTWAYEFSQAFPDYTDSEERLPVTRFFKDFWRRSYLYPNGDLLAIYGGFGMVKIDRESRLLWAAGIRCHHDMFIDEDGLIYVLTRKSAMLPRYDPDREVIEEFITVLDPQGELVREVSVIDAFERSSYASFLENIVDKPDMFHTNTVEVLNGMHADRSPIFKKGNVLISIRNINVIAIIDMVTETVVWALSGQWLAQHEPELLPNGNILLLDNKGHRGMSKVIEFDPFTQEIVWAYDGTPENGFYTESSGTTHRLPNGNTLIVESNSGRAFEVDRDHRIVWEYYNPYRAGEHQDLIATLFDVVRVESAYVATWLEDVSAKPALETARE